jgi:polyhydroxybutyrate depolymerase
MIDVSASAKSQVQRSLALLWILTSTAGCAEKDSAVSPEQRSTGAALQSVEVSKTLLIDETEFRSEISDVAKLSAGCGAEGLGPGIHHLSLKYGGWERSYVASVPAAVESLSHPLLIVMHGYGGSGVGMRSAIGRQSGFEDGYVVLYPDGAGSSNSVRGWNSGHPQCCGTALHDDVDDVAFLRALVDTVAQETCVDLNRVYATGFSNGGDMAQRLACDARDVVTAVTSVAGRFDYHASACPGQRSVPAVLYRGQLDRTVPYQHNLFSLAAIKTIPAIEGFEQIAGNHKCRGNPSKALSVRNTDCVRFDKCDDGFEITLCTSVDAGHCWPGEGGCSRTRGDGAAEFSASSHMRDFFSQQMR